MQWIFMLVGLVLGALLGATNGEVLAGAALGAVLGLAAGQALALQALKLQHEALRKSLAELIARFNHGTGDLHERLVRLEQGAVSPRNEVPPEEAEVPLVQVPAESAAAAPVEHEWALELVLPAVAPIAQPSPEPVSYTHLRAHET